MQISRTSALPDPPIRAVRKSEWLRCALAHHFNPDPGVENEIVVLATGIDQYLQEIFHHLAYYSNDDVISEEDFRLLCLVLGMTTEKNQRIPPVLNFREFHSRLCGFFTVKSHSGTTATRLPVTEETEHIEREISLRWPRVRRRKCVSFDLSRDLKTSRLNAFEKTGNLKTPAVELRKGSGLDGQQRAGQEQVEMENASLRELVEDLRSALQSSDARCMALEVALRRGRPAATRHGSPGGTGPRGTPSPGHVSRRRTGDLLRELELIRASRDGQLEEAMRFNQRLEEELAVAYSEAGRLSMALGSVRRENAEIKRRAEGARGALATGLERVHAVQLLAEQVGPLQEKAQSLEREMQRFRSLCTCRAACEPGAEVTQPMDPSGQDELLVSGEERLQRAVEGRAASDEEEEEERHKEVEQCCLLEVKRLINRLHKCAKGCQKPAVCHLLRSQNSGLYPEQCGCRVLRGKETAGWHHVPPEQKELEKDLQQKQQEVDGLRLGVQTAGTGLVRLSLLEEKLTDALSLLLQLRDKRVSRRALRNLLLDTLDLCSRRDPHPHPTRTPVFQVVDILCQRLTSSELLYRAEGGVVWFRPSVTPGLQSTINPLLISC
ncbi:EF-hand and coiled-coil domain-containing protein 1 [Electrophorus electricus]|uniref:EF-hand and coiled-coil domain-containing protein 1 n=1 Tax=Electrophorus electricus TaxID=8005 RepID=UPI0015CF883D|nr:EF-hand and coiled-coil domain-containing protein 1 [Electrophorus electricus]